MNAASSSLPRRRFGRTDMNITRVGFGAWAIGGGDWAFSWGEQDDAESIAAIRRAVQRGVNWIDTAAVYGLGHSEEVVRRALADMPVGERPYLFTKCGLVWTDRNSDIRRIGAPASIRRELDASLKRLGVERVDLYQMHWPAKDTPLEDYWGTLLELKKEDKARAALTRSMAGAPPARLSWRRTICTTSPPPSRLRTRGAGRRFRRPRCCVQAHAFPGFGRGATYLIDGAAGMTGFSLGARGKDGDECRQADAPHARHGGSPGNSAKPVGRALFCK